MKQEVATDEHQVDNLKKLIAGLDPDDTEAKEAKLKKREAELNDKKAELAKKQTELEKVLEELILKVRIKMN